MRAHRVKKKENENLKIDFSLFNRCVNVSVSENFHRLFFTFSFIIYYCWKIVLKIKLF